MSRHRLHLCALVLAMAVLVGLDALGAFRAAEDALVEARMAAAPIEASGAVVLVAIDPRTIDEFGVWPWPRRVYAELIGELVAAGATEILLDIDLSARSTPEEDAALARTLDQAGGAVVLPVFQQRLSPEMPRQGANLPLVVFRRHARLAVVNIEADRDGVVRRAPFAAVVGGRTIRSASAVLSGVSGPAGSEFLINFAIEPESVPVVPAIDVLANRSAPDVDGRSVVVGAYALELRDALAVPVHAVLPWAMVQILATETLAQGIAPTTLDRYPAIAAVSLLAAILAASRKRSLPFVLVCLGGLAAAVETVAFWAQTEHAIIVATPILHALLLATAIAVAGRELDLRRWLLHLARLEKTNVERILERVISDSSDAILVVDERLAIIRISRSARELFAAPDTIRRGAPLADVVPPEMLAAAREGIASLGRPQAAGSETRDLTFERDGETRHVEYTVTPSRLWRASQPSRTIERRGVACLTARDVTADRAQRARIDRLARFDAMTGALNRSEFVERLSAHVRSRGRGCAVIAFSIHRFQTVNSTLGRSVGDALLAAFVERIDRAPLGISPVARLGGDRFAAFTLGPATEAVADRIARRLARMLEAPFHLDDHTVRIGLRVGVAPGEAEDSADVLLNKAELALDEARLRAGPGLRTFDRTAFAKQARARQIERAHWSALAEDQMHLAYQPQVRLCDGSLVCAEALLRWHHPEMGPISPAEFIRIAESSGFIERLGRWVLEEACLAAADWPVPIDVAVNVSPVQFNRGDVVADVERALYMSGLSPKRLCLEITESVFVEGSRDLGAIFARLRALGVSLALDDFGTGFSSLGYLARLPLDKLKLDRMFVQGLATDPSSEVVTRSVVSLCRELELALVCEGVETLAQRDMLRALDCELAQGYFFARPEPQEAFLERLLEASAAFRDAG